MGKRKLKKNVRKFLQMSLVLVGVSGFLLMLGSVGAYEVNNINVSRMICQSGIGIVMLSTSILVHNKI